MFMLTFMFMCVVLQAFPMRDQHFYASIDKAQALLGWTPKYGLVDGLKDSYDKDFGRGMFRKAADFEVGGWMGTASLPQARALEVFLCQEGWLNCSRNAHEQQICLPNGCGHGSMDSFPPDCTSNNILLQYSDDVGATKHSITATRALPR